MKADPEDNVERRIVISYGRHYVYLAMYDLANNVVPEYEEVFRQPKILLQYQDEHFKEYEEEFEGFAARVIQHEHDHLDGVLFTDHLTPLRRRLLQGKLRDISVGRTEAKYKMRFHATK